MLLDEPSDEQTSFCGAKGREVVQTTLCFINALTMMSDLISRILKGCHLEHHHCPGARRNSSQVALYSLERYSASYRSPGLSAGTSHRRTRTRGKGFDKFLDMGIKQKQDLHVWNR